jgi:hypothetical protein
LLELVELRQIDGPSPDAAQFESEALWQNVHGQVRAGDRVLIVRGTSPATAPVVGNAGMPMPSTQAQAVTGWQPGCAKPEPRWNCWLL